MTLRANSFECKQASTTNEQERFRMQKRAYVNDDFFSLSKWQQATISKSDLEVIQRLGDHFYGKGAK